MFKRNSYFYYALNNGMFYFGWAMFACVLTIYLSDKNCSATQISLITSASAMCALVSQPVCGFLADKYRSPKKVAIFAAILTMITGITFSYTNSFILLFLFNGLTQGVLNGMVALTDRLATSSPYPYGSIRLWGSLIYALGAQVSGFIYENVSPQANYFIFAFSTILVVISFLRMDEKIPQNSVNNTPKITTGEVVKALIKNKPFVWFMVIYFLFQGVTNAQGAYFALFISELGAGTTAYGTMILIFTLFEIPIIFFSDKLFAHLSYKWIMMIACVMSLIRFVWYSTCPTPTQISMIFFFQGLTGMLFALVAVKVVLALVEDQYVNTAYGISSMLAKGLSTLMFQMMAGRIIDMNPGLLGYQITYWIYAAVMVICILLCFNFKDKKEHIKKV